MIESKSTLRMLAVHIVDPRGDTEEEIYSGEELESLITTLGGEVTARLVQKIVRPHPSTYIRPGKLEEIVSVVKEKEIDIVVLNAIVKPTQTHNIKLSLEQINPQIEVWDRVDLILHIFDKHAATTEAKLQIELARMRYMGPRIYGMGFILSRQGGGIGTVGIGETNSELMRRHWKDAMKHVTDELEKISKNKKEQLEKRKRLGFQTVSIVGYTNAGKSSLFNVLAKKNAYVENELFATLDSSIGKMYIPALSSEVLITDTIGFIRDLPPRLIDAFKSTLMESIHADLLLFVMDASDPELETKMSVVMNILLELGRTTDDMIFVFNKMDKATLDKEAIVAKYARFTPLFISVKDGIGLDSIKDAIGKRFAAYTRTPTN